MKKLIFLLLVCLPIMAIGQTRYHVLDSLTIESDTTIYYQMVNSKNFSFHIFADSLAGTLDGTVELVAANTFDDTNNFRSTAEPTYTSFARYTASMTETLSANGYYSFFNVDNSYEWIGLKFTVGNISKWHIKWLFLKIVD